MAERIPRRATPAIKGAGGVEKGLLLPFASFLRPPLLAPVLRLCFPLNLLVARFAPLAFVRYFRRLRSMRWRPTRVRSLRQLERWVQAV